MSKRVQAGGMAETTMAVLIEADSRASQESPFLSTVGSRWHHPTTIIEPQQ